MMELIKNIIVNEFFKQIVSSFIGAGIIAFINIKFIKIMNMKTDYKINTYREFFMAIEKLIEDKSDDSFKSYSTKRNLLMIYSSDDFLNALIEFEEKGLGIKHDEQKEFDKALYKLVEQARFELGNKKNNRKKEWSKYFYFARFTRFNK